MSRNDSYTNAISGMGTSRDKTSGSVFVRKPDLSPEELSAMFEQDPLVARIVNRLPDDATREGFQLKDANTQFDFASMHSDLEDVSALPNIADAWRWSRLFGGALLFMSVNDGQKMEEPLDLAHATALNALHVIESPYVMPSGHNPGLGSRAFRNPEHYEVLLPFGSTANIRKIHRSRVIRFDGMKVPPSRIVSANGWGPSIVSQVREDVTRLGSVMGYAANIIHDISILVLKIDGWRNMLAGGEADKKEAGEIIASLRWNIDNLNTLALDKSDELVELSRTVSGLEKLLNHFVDAVVRATDMPRTVLLGEQPGGLNASADSEIRSWFDFVAGQQKQVLTPVLTRLLHVLFAIRSKSEKVPDKWTIEYDALWQPTDKEKAETLATYAGALDKLILNEVIAPDTATDMLVTAGLIPSA